MVFRIGVRTAAKQLAGDPDESIRSFGRIAVQASVAHVKKWLPILHSTWLHRCFRVCSQAGLYRPRITKYVFSE
jgi:hypothetical protein